MPASDLLALLVELLRCLLRAFSFSVPSGLRSIGRVHASLGRISSLTQLSYQHHPTWLSASPNLVIIDRNMNSSASPVLVLKPCNVGAIWAAGQRVSVRGFSLLELMVVVAIVAILAGLATPSFIELLRSNRLASASSALQVSLNLARSEAVKRGADARVTVVANGVAGNWTNGWTVFFDKSANAHGYVGPTSDDLTATGWTRLEVVGAPTGPLSFGPSVAGPTYFSYNGQGRMTDLAGESLLSPAAVWFSDRTSQKYCLTFSSTGRIRTSRVDSSVSCPTA